MPVVQTTHPKLEETVKSLEKGGNRIVQVTEAPNALYVLYEPWKKYRQATKGGYETRRK